MRMKQKPLITLKFKCPPNSFTCSIYDALSSTWYFTLFSFFNLSLQLFRSHSNKHSLILFYDSKDKIGKSGVTIWGSIRPCYGSVISTSNVKHFTLPILYLFQSSLMYMEPEGAQRLALKNINLWTRKKGAEKIAKRSDAFLFSKTRILRIYWFIFVCGVCKSSHVRTVAKWMFNFIFRLHSNVKRINKKNCSRDVYLFVGWAW